MNVLVISAHPDDETLGCGGTLLKHRDSGDTLSWVIVTAMLKDQGFAPDKIDARKREIAQVAKKIGFQKTYELNLPTMSLDSSGQAKLIAMVSKIFSESKPEVVYVVNRSDAHSDHRHTFDAVMACTKSFRYPYVKKVLMYECLSETEFAPALPEKQFLPNYFVDITAHFSEKMELLDVYRSELGEHPFPRSKRNIEALAVQRGARAGVEYAEAFSLLYYLA